MVKGTELENKSHSEMESFWDGGRDVSPRSYGELVATLRPVHSRFATRKRARTPMTRAARVLLKRRLLAIGGGRG